MIQTGDYIFRYTVYQHTTIFVKTYMHNAIILFFFKQGNNKYKFKTVVGESQRDIKGKKHTSRLKLLMI